MGRVKTMIKSLFKLIWPHIWVLKRNCHKIRFYTNTHRGLKQKMFPNCSCQRVQCPWITLYFVLINHFTKKKWGTAFQKLNFCFFLLFPELGQPLWPYRSTGYPEKKVLDRITNNCGGVGNRGAGRWALICCPYFFIPNGSAYQWGNLTCFKSWVV